MPRFCRSLRPSYLWATAACCAGLLLAGCAGGPSATRPSPPRTTPPSAPLLAFEYLGLATLPVGLEVDGVPVGGLSALAYEAGSRDWLALSDDSARRGPARFYRLAIRLDDGGRLSDDGVEIVSAHRLLGADGKPFAEGSVDPEGMALTPAGTLLIASEGDAKAGLPPFLGEFHLPPVVPAVPTVPAGAEGASRTESRDESRVRRFLEIPDRFLPRRDAAGRPRGVRHNLAFEALTLTPGGTLLVGTEGPLAQDGPQPAPGVGARVRVLRYDLAAGRPVGEFLYPLDPLPVPPSPQDGFAVNGLVEMLALTDTTALALERAYIVGRGHFLRLYRVSLVDGAAADSSALDALPRPAEGTAPRVLEKSLVLDLSTLGVELFNVEGIALGPELADGRRLLVLVSDDNFAAEQRSQFFAFAVDPERLIVAPPPMAPGARIAEVQGAGHVSPLVGRDVEVAGIVTGIVPAGSRGGAPGGELGLWLQDPAGDGDPATSEGLFIALPPAWAPAPALDPVSGLDAAMPAGEAGGALTSLAVGDWVRVTGRVVELGRPGGLSVTALSLWPGGRLRLVEAGVGVPPALRLGDFADGTTTLCPPGPVIDDDGLTRFEPGSDGIDFWESLEGMRLELAAPEVVGPTSRYGEIFAVAAGCARGGRSVHGGLMASDEDLHPERIALAPRLAAGRAPELRVGQRFAGPVAGVVDYDFANFRLLPEAWPAAEAATWQPQATHLTDRPGQLTVASLNLENLSVVDRSEKFARLAETLVEGLGSPHLVALQEVQDDSGPADDGVVTSAATLARFVDAVVAAGGPLYGARWLDPPNNADGGRPGGNIRNAFLFDPDRVDPVDRLSAASVFEETLDPAADVAEILEVSGEGVSLMVSLHRLVAANPAFRRSRKPLVAQVEIDGRPLFVVINHFASKGGDDALFGPVQPPGRSTDAQRTAQARVVADFVAALLALDPEARVVVLGDLNDFPGRSTLAPLTEAGLVNLIDRLAPAERYTYVYQGNSQVLDHILVSPSLAAGTEIDAVHRHADLPDAEKPSDHDPVVARLPWPASQ